VSDVRVETGKRGLKSSLAEARVRVFTEARGVGEHCETPLKAFFAQMSKPVDDWPRDAFEEDSAAGTSL
jgi:hypothetical protein